MTERPDVSQRVLSGAVTILVVGLALTASAACGRRHPIGRLDADVETDAAPQPDAATDTAERVVPFGARALSLGRVHTCVVLDDGRAKCWGFADYGVLGQGDTRHRGRDPSEMGDALPAIDLGTGRTVLQLDAGGYATCAVLDDHSVKCWGFTFLPPREFVDFIGDGPGEMGDALPVMDLGAGHTAKQVGVGVNACCVVRDDDTLRCWARDGQGPHDVPLPAGRHVVAMEGAMGVGLLFDDGSVGEALFPSSELAPVPLLRMVELGAGARARSLSSARQRPLCAVLEDDPPACEEADPGVLRLATRGPLLAIAQMETVAPCALRRDGTVSCIGDVMPQGSAWAEREDAEAGTVHVKLPGPAIDLQGGGQYHVCVRLADHSVRCWPDGFPFPALLGGSFPDEANPELGAQARWLPVDLGTPQGTWPPAQ